MITLILKYWRWILDILIVIAICIAFSYFDPFHMFRKVQLKQTANIVSSIKDIGQLVTAEYYGETISYLNDDVEAESIKLDTLAESFVFNVTEALDRIKKRDPRRTENFGITEEFKAIKTIYGIRYKYLVLYFAEKVYSDSRWNTWRIERWFRKGKIDNIEDLLFGNFRNQPPNFDNQTFIGFKTFYNTELPKETKTVKENIILIARGTVKAGFDFGKLDERNFLYNPDKKQIRLYGITAQMLDTIINPWFIPQLGIPGYEFVNNPSGDDYTKVIEVKNKCRLRLAKQAFDAGIVEQARINGKQVFQNFFSVLLDEPDISVTFNEIPYKDMLVSITIDSVITEKEAVEIAPILEQYKRVYSQTLANDRKDLEFEQKIIINNLKSCWFIKKFNYHFNPYALEYAKLDTLIKSQKVTKSKKYFYQNDSLDANQVAIRFLTLLRDTLSESNQGKVSGYTTQFLANNPFWYNNDTSTVFINDFNSVIKQFCNHPIYLELQKLAYPNFDISSANIDSTSLFNISKIDTLVNMKVNSIDWFYQCEKDIVRKVETKNARYLLESKPIKQFSKFIQKTISLN